MAKYKFLKRKCKHCGLAFLTWCGELQLCDSCTDKRSKIQQTTDDIRFYKRKGPPKNLWTLSINRPHLGGPAGIPFQRVAQAFVKRRKPRAISFELAGEFQPLLDIAHKNPKKKSDYLGIVAFQPRFGAFQILMHLAVLQKIPMFASDIYSFRFSALSIELDRQLKVASANLDPAGLHKFVQEWRVGHEQLARERAKRTAWSLLKLTKKTQGTVLHLATEDQACRMQDALRYPEKLRAPTAIRLEAGDRHIDIPDLDDK